jgi:hypothetical protein
MPTALLGSWVQQPIKDMMSFGTDFETHANWQGNVEEPAAKDFVARKARTIALSELQGIHWDMIKSKLGLGIAQSCHRTSNNQPYSQLWKSLEALPELYYIT